MKITRLELFTVPPRWLFLKVSTDAGIEGWGEPVVEGRAETVAAAVRELEYCLLGQDPRRIEDLWQAMYRGGFYRGGPVLTSAMSGVEQALWDIKGKALGVPVYELLGGPVRESMRVYSWIGGDRPGDTAAQARERAARGFTAIKMNGSEELQYVDTYDKVDRVLANVAAVREAVGPHFGIGVDFHGRVHKPMAKVLFKELEPYRLMFIEEPVLSEHAECLREFATLANIPIALGERLFSRWDFKKILEGGYVDIIQPDLVTVGGLMETKRVADYAERRDMPTVLHSAGSPIMFMANIHAGAAIRSLIAQEIHALDIPFWKDLVTGLDDPLIVDGYVRVPDRPGLGVDLNLDAIREHLRLPGPGLFEPTEGWNTPGPKSATLSNVMVPDWALVSPGAPAT